MKPYELENGWVLAVNQSGGYVLAKQREVKTGNDAGKVKHSDESFYPTLTAGLTAWHKNLIRDSTAPAPQAVKEANAAYCRAAQDLGVIDAPAVLEEITRRMASEIERRILGTPTGDGAQTRPGPRRATERARTAAA